MPINSLCSYIIDPSFFCWMFARGAVGAPVVDGDPGALLAMFAELHASHPAAGPCPMSLLASLISFF